jgi:hypothetical protein
MTSFQVQVPSLLDGSESIRLAAQIAGTARESARSAGSRSGAFGTEPITATFEEMCTRADQALDELQNALGMLSDSVGRAAFGYLTTDQGVVRACEQP